MFFSRKLLNFIVTATPELYSRARPSRLDFFSFSLTFARRSSLSPAAFIFTGSRSSDARGTHGRLNLDDEAFEFNWRGGILVGGDGVTVIVMLLFDAWRVLSGYRSHELSFNDVHVNSNKNLYESLITFTNYPQLGKTLA